MTAAIIKESDATKTITIIIVQAPIKSIGLVFWTFDTRINNYQPISDK